MPWAVVFTETNEDLAKCVFPKSSWHVAGEDDDGFMDGAKIAEDMRLERLKDDNGK